MAPANGGVMTPHRGIDWCVMCSKHKDDVDAIAVASGSATRPMFSLRCGHGICRVCLPQVVRASLSSRLVPARCCTTPIPDTLVRSVLDQEEFDYYSYLLRKSKSPTPAAAAAAPSPPTTDHAQAPSPLPEPRRKAKAATEPAQAPSPPPTPATRSKGKAKPTRKPAASKRVPALALTHDDAAETGQASSAACHACSTGILDPNDRFTAPCKHLLCRDCVVARCRHAIANDQAPGGIGVPVRCCDLVLPLGFVSHALSKRDLTKYSSLLAKFEAGHKTFPRKSSARGQSIGQKRTASATALDGAIAETRKKLRSSDGSKASVEGDSVEDCVSCMQQISTAARRVKGPCGHAYCPSCFGYMAKLSLEDRSMVPVRCCGVEFPEDDVKRVLPAKSWAAYRRFLADKKPGESTLKSDKEYAALVRKIKGKQCPQCGIGVKKTAGCHTMTCPLGHVFCWNCSLQVCACAGPRLMPRANAQTQNQ